VKETHHSALCMSVEAADDCCVHDRKPKLKGLQVVCQLFVSDCECIIVYERASRESDIDTLRETETNTGKEMDG